MLKSELKERIRRAAIATEAVIKEKRKRDRRLYKFLMGQYWLVHELA